MAKLVVDHDDLVVDLSRVEKVGAFHGSVRVPISAVKGVRYVDRARTEIRGIRLPGTWLPWIIALGRWRTLFHSAFVATRKSNPGYVVDLEGQKFDYLVVSSPRVASLNALIN